MSAEIVVIWVMSAICWAMLAVAINIGMPPLACVMVGFIAASGSASAWILRGVNR